MKYIFTSLILLAAVISFQACGDNSSDQPKPEGKTVTVYNDLVFSISNAYFATNGKTKRPIKADSAKKVIANIDLSYIYNQDYSKPGFFDPVSRSASYYWDDFVTPWTSNAIQTKFYYCNNLTMDHFDAVKSDKDLLDVYFEDSLSLAPHGIFPEGSCIGGRTTSDPYSISMRKGMVFGFINTKSMKRGLVYVHSKQENYWPDFSTSTLVSILVEN